MPDSSSPSPAHSPAHPPAVQQRLERPGPIFGAGQPAPAGLTGPSPRDLGCPACGHASPSTLDGAADYRACAGCGSLQSLVPEGDYQEGYYFHDAGLDAAGRRRAELQLRHFDRLRPELDGLTVRHADDLRVLELGCSKGYFVELLLRRGHDVDGVDLSAVACDQAARRGLGSRCLQASALESVPAGIEPPYDLLVAFELLEHFDAPAEFLGHVRRLVRPGGWLIGSTPNLDSWWHRRLGQAWHGRAIHQYHRSVLGRTGVEALAERSGWSEVQCLSVTERTPERLQRRNRAVAAARRFGRDGFATRALYALAQAPHESWLEWRTASYGRHDGDTLLFALRRPLDA